MTDFIWRLSSVMDKKIPGIIEYSQELKTQMMKGQNYGLFF
ncbi:hypothetical protein SAMN05444409_3480 [Epilithonimonas zeae]|uniref:Uncharacterized protein n=1 Tax=Epilithonimonas zeae TaxID=1416779 RepID=A0A1N6JJU2_9FLAO|nr:hypothetical protein SAMN05444409_3480 [Epilithonimonas zeae]